MNPFTRLNPDQVAKILTATMDAFREVTKLAGEVPINYSIDARWRSLTLQLFVHDTSAVSGVERKSDSNGGSEVYNSGELEYRRTLEY
ncbi:MAG: hypothetical protein AB7I44_21195 [Hyphomicrobiaceae bacterium]